MFELSSEMLEQIQQNADKMGLDVILSSTQEECAELIQAISKYNRARGIGQRTNIPLEDAESQLIEELADVKLCIEEILYLTGCDITDMIDKKTEKVRKSYEK